MLPADSTRKSILPSPTRAAEFRKLSAVSGPFDEKENTMEIIPFAKTPTKEMERVVEPPTTAGKRSSTIKSPD